MGRLFGIWGGVCVGSKRLRWICAMWKQRILFGEDLKKMKMT